MMKKIMIKSLSTILAILLAVSALAGCSDSSEPSVISLSAEENIIAELHTPAQEKYLGKDYKKTGSAKGVAEKSRPLPVQFKWQADSTGNYQLKISENADMSDATVYSLDTNSFELYNLKIATEYFWTVTQDGKESKINSFETCDEAPRNIFVDGITNVRDLGGWKTENGKRTKQNLIFRCGRLNESSAKEPVIEITDEGKHVLLEEFCVKTEIDLRKTADGETGAITESPLGSAVNYISCPMEWEGDTFNGNKEQLLKVFSLLAEQTEQE